MPPTKRPEPPDASDPIRDLFRASGASYTVQRQAVLECLAARADHPTADEVYGDVAARFPSLSKATIYRSLETLVGLGLARRIAHPGSAARYDHRTDRHHHLICDACGQVQDLEDRALRHRISLPARPVAGFRARDFSVQLHGLCKDCAAAAR